MALALDTRWSLLRREDITVRDWPDGTVVFDDANGQLQCLSPVSGNLMALLAQRPQWTARELATELLGEPPTAEDVEMVQNALAEFSSLNLLERVAV